MAELKIYLSSGLSDRFRRIAMSVYGYGRGSLSKAAEEAFAKWCAEHDKPLESRNATQVETEKSPVESGIDPDERRSSDFDSKEPVDGTGQSQG